MSSSNSDDNAVYVAEVLEGLPPDALLTVRQVAATLCRSCEYVRGLAESGELKTLRGRTRKRKRILIVRSSLVEYLKNNIQ